MTNSEKFAENLASDPTQQAVAARTAAYQDYVATHGHPPIVEPSGIILNAAEPAGEVAHFRSWDAEVELSHE